MRYSIDRSALAGYMNSYCAQHAVQSPTVRSATQWSFRSFKVVVDKVVMASDYVIGKAFVEESGSAYCNAITTHILLSGNAITIGDVQELESRVPTYMRLARSSDEHLLCTTAACSTNSAPYRADPVDAPAVASTRVVEDVLPTFIAVDKHEAAFLAAV